MRLVTDHPWIGASPATGRARFVHAVSPEPAKPDRRKLSHRPAA
ncbi:MAG: hypothetical protein ACXVR0_18150 [Solirubrobacteraceae bacterium]